SEKHGSMSVLPERNLVGEAPIITMNNTPIVTVNSLQSEKEQLLNTHPQFINPQLKEILSYMDPDSDRALAEWLMDEAIVDRYISEQGIDQLPSYKEMLCKNIKTVERMVK